MSGPSDIRDHSAPGLAAAPDADSLRHLAESVRAACVDAAQAAYEDAKIRGLCDAGAWEHAVGVLRTLDAGSLLNNDEESSPYPAP